MDPDRDAVPTTDPADATPTTDPAAARRDDDRMPRRVPRLLLLIVLTYFGALLALSAFRALRDLLSYAEGRTCVPFRLSAGSRHFGVKARELWLVPPGVSRAKNVWSKQYHPRFLFSSYV